MKAFSLEEYLKNPLKKLVTKEGKTVKRILCTDARGGYPVIALVDCGDYDSAFSYTKDGKHIEYKSSSSDLFFATEKHEGWVNVYEEGTNRYLDGCICVTKEEAKRIRGCGYITTIKIEWEE